MPDTGALVTAVAIGLLLVVMLWFTFGTQRNIRRGNDVLRWLQDGLPLLGPRATLRWLGSSVAELTIVEPVPPLRAAQVLVVLEPRDVALLWAFARSRQRRDTLIVRVSLQRAPTVELEVADEATWAAAEARERIDDHTANDGWSGSNFSPLTSDGSGPWLRSATASGTDHEVPGRLWSRLARSGCPPVSVSVQRVVPHLEVRFASPAMNETRSRDVVTAMLDVARDLAGGSVPGTSPGR